MSYDLQDYRDKYQHDVTYIKDYVEYLEKYFLVSIRMIENLRAVSATLSKNPRIPNICDNNAAIQAEMEGYLRCIEKEKQALAIKEKDPAEPSAGDPTPEGNVISSVTIAIRTGEHDPQKLFREAQSQIEAMCIIKGDTEGFEDYIFLNDAPGRVRKLVEIAVEDEKRRKHKALCAEHTYVGMAAKSLDLFDYSNQINLYKQNFIQIMAYFDSCVFDMIRFCMKQKFFEWLAYFDNVSIKTHDMAASGTFDVFKDRQIEATLKKCYVKDLLSILHDKFSGIFVIGGDDIYSILQEMIGRRNVHIHHNGIADQMYLANYNIYKVALGDYLPISKDYFEKAVEVTQQVVSSIAQINI